MSLDIYGESKKGNDLFRKNITHNLRTMANAAGVYNALWRAPENNIVQARQLVPILKVGIEKLTSNPEEFYQFNSENGWGTYDQFLPWLKELLEECQTYPNAYIRISR